MIEWLRDENQSPVIELSGRMIPIELNRHARAKRLTLRLSPDGSAVRITLPHWCRSAEAIKFAAIRKDWLETQLAKVPARQDVLTRGTLKYRGQELAIAWSEGAPRKPRLGDDAVVVGGPRDTLSKRLQRWLEGEAAQLMSADLAEYCERAALPAPELRLTRAQRRWGSCSSKGIVRVNWRLVQAPDAARRSVVAHETAHLVHFDHSREFHALLAAIYGADVGKQDRWLREHGRSLYTDFG